MAKDARHRRCDRKGKGTEALTAVVKGKHCGGRSVARHESQAGVLHNLVTARAGKGSFALLTGAPDQDGGLLGDGGQLALRQEVRTVNITNKSVQVLFSYTLSTLLIPLVTGYDLELPGEIAVSHFSDFSSRKQENPWGDSQLSCAGAAVTKGAMQPLKLHTGGLMWSRHQLAELHTALWMGRVSPQHSCGDLGQLGHENGEQEGDADVDEEVQHRCHRLRNVAMHL